MMVVVLGGATVAGTGSESLSQLSLGSLGSAALRGDTWTLGEVHLQPPTGGGFLGSKEGMTSSADHWDIKQLILGWG